MTLKDLGHSSFASVSKEEWLAKARKELKEKPYEDLFWQHPELGEIEPYLTQEEVEAGFTLPPKAYGGEMNDWQIRQTFRIQPDSKTTEVNAHLLKALEHGAGGVVLEIAEGVDADKVSEVLKGVYLEMIDLTLVFSKGDLLVEEKLINALKIKQENHLKKGCIAFDPITEAFHQGAGACAVQEDHLSAHLTSLKHDRFRAFRVEAANYFEAGMSEVHEIAIALHLGQLYWKAMQKHGMSGDSVSPLIEFHLSAGSSYFTSIAKFRCFRQMWAHLAEASGIQEDCSVVTWVHATGSQRHFAQNDKHNNLLRLTTSAMAAVLGCCDSLDLPSFEPWRTQEAHHYRWSRNIQHLLKDESMLNVVADPAGGSYYIEELTNRMIDAAAGAFEALEQQPITTAGGTTLVTGWLQNDRKALEDAFISGNQALIGVNKYQPDQPVSEESWERLGGRLRPLRLAHLNNRK